MPSSGDAHRFSFFSFFFPIRLVRVNTHRHYVYISSRIYTHLHTQTRNLMFLLSRRSMNKTGVQRLSEKQWESEWVCWQISLQQWQCIRATISVSGLTGLAHSWTMSALRMRTLLLTFLYKHARTGTHKHTHRHTLRHQCAHAAPVPHSCNAIYFQTV